MNWAQQEQAKAKQGKEQLDQVGRLEKRKLEIIKKINELDHSKARYMQSIRAINDAIAEITGSVG